MPWIIGGIVVVLGAMLLLWVREATKLPIVSIPAPVMPSPNAYDYFAKAASIVHDRDTNTLAEKEAEMRKNAAVLATLRQEFAYPYVHPPIRSFSTTYSMSAKLRELARMLNTDSQVKAAHEYWSGSVNSNLDAIQLGIMVPHGSPLIGTLVGNACESIGRQPIWRNYDHLNSVQAQAAALRLEALANHRMPFADMLQQEEWTGQASLLEIFREPHWRRQMAELTSSSGGGNIHILEIRLLLLTSKRQIFNNYTKYMDKAIAIGRQPYATAQQMPPLPDDPFCRPILSSYTADRFKSINNDTQDALLMTTLALHAYHEANNRYPASLTALVPKYLTDIPNDPFAASASLRYRRSAASYLLYSVGPDGKDDSGAALVSTSPPPPSPYVFWAPREVKPNSKGDIVAGINIY